MKFVLHDCLVTIHENFELSTAGLFVIPELIPGQIIPPLISADIVQYGSRIHGKLVTLFFKTHKKI